MKILNVNRYATFEYEILDKYVAGIVLCGEEIKAARMGLLNVKDAFGVVTGGEIMLLNCYIGHYKNSFITNALSDERRSRKLLLTKREIKRLIGEVSQRGLTLIPLKAFLNDRGFLKIEIGVAKHKKVYDKRREIRERDLNRETRRDLKKFGL
jgi:SsrA-binding protein